MVETRKETTKAAVDAVQEGRELQGVQDVQAPELTPGGVEGLEKGTAAQKAATPEGGSAPLGRQEETPGPDEAKFIEYTVTSKTGLRLRQEPRLDAAIVAVLPWGSGVSGNSSPAENGWRQVFTGRLFGWMMDEYLEPLELSGDLVDG